MNLATSRCADWLEDLPSIRWQGQVVRAVGHLIEAEGVRCKIGDCCELIDNTGRRYAGEVVGFRGHTVLAMPLERLGPIGYGDRVVASGRRPSLPVGMGMLGRVIDGTGAPLDSKGPFKTETEWPLDHPAPQPLTRQAIKEPLGCGIRTVDAFLACGRGQRMGIFGGSGVGKSTMISMMARGTSADFTVLALVGERGREVGEFLTDCLGSEGLRRSVVVVSTSDQSPLLRIRAALAATAIAEYLCSRRGHVLLVIDSLTRFAMAQREIGLSAGEPPTARGYTPSVFSLLARLLERAGRFQSGSITGFYTVLMEGDDQQDPLVDAARSLLDGHVMLDRRLAARGQFPPVAVLDSVSRLMPAVCTSEHVRKAQRLRELLAVFDRCEDLMRIGAYQKGSDPLLDEAAALMPRLEKFLRQDASECSSRDETVAGLAQL